jgi:hypothetical protein
MQVPRPAHLDTLSWRLQRFDAWEHVVVDRRSSGTVMPATFDARAIEHDGDPADGDQAPARQEPVEQYSGEHRAVVAAECCKTSREAQLDRSASSREDCDLCHELGEDVDEDHAPGRDRRVDRHQRGVQREAVGESIGVGERHHLAHAVHANVVAVLKVRCDPPQELYEQAA